ncbi:hypothetical protein AB0C12_43075 [Actinoplanes sp. NPDC048967]|uniref:YaaC family protein n=1 Tax=Actinoplanes sp. NPDC048967 TaxID=3155269 RepID=UPI0033E7AD86
MVTFRDLALPSRAEVWRQLRGLRVSPPGAAVSRDRAAVFQAALEQSQQLMEAAEISGYASRPIQLFYALAQGGRAIAAASPLLPLSIEIPDEQNSGQQVFREIPWRLEGHGIKAPGIKVRSVGKVVIKAEGTGLLPGVARALGAEIMPPNVKITLADIWDLIPEAKAVPLRTRTSTPVLCAEGGAEKPTHDDGYYTMTLGYVPPMVQKNWVNDPQELQRFLASYPSLAGWTFPLADSTPQWQPYGSTDALSLSLNWRWPAPGTPEYEHTARELKATRYRGFDDWWVFPALPGMTAPLHPIIAWWGTLFGLSMLARYAPDTWAHLIRIDDGGDANATEHLLDAALDVVPALVLEAIMTVSP